MTPSYTLSSRLDSMPETGFVAGSAYNSRADGGRTSLGGGLSTVLRAEGGLAVVVESVGSFLPVDVDIAAIIVIVIILLIIAVAVAASKTDCNRRGADGLYHATAGFRYRHDPLVASFG
ncbi:hypothetical protein BRD05_06100 [Halobacteriales archaeon QS_9_70_65]|nr:MAG: hypothetical protein BRD05_06100 [Halobacteriales archaeon QS_9_70_65]